MITTLGKALAVVTFVGSLTFLGFVIVGSFGGKNWRAEADELPDYVFAQTEGESPEWTVKSRRSYEDFQSRSKGLPQVVIDAHNDLKAKQDDELARLERDIQAVEANLRQAERLIEIDRAALEQHAQQLQTALDELNRTIKETTEAGNALSDNARTTRVEVRERREDVQRLQVQLAAIRADRFRAVEQQKRLVDLLTRYRGQVDVVRRRNQSLQRRLEGYTANSPAEADQAVSSNDTELETNSKSDGRTP